MEDKERQERSEVFAWLRGGDMTPDPEMEERFIDMIAEAVIAKTGMRRRPGRTVTSPLSLKALMKSVGIDEKDMPDLGSVTPVPPKVEELHVTAEKATEPGEGWEIDSVMVAKTIVHLACMEHLTLSMSHIQMILYIAYGVWLAKNHTSLFDEHPQVWQFGPVFPRVYNKFKRGFDDAVQVHDRMKSEHPSQYNFLNRCFRRFAWMRAHDLTQTHIADGTPWMDTRKKNPDKLGVRIEDDLIEKWFEKRL